MERVLFHHFDRDIELPPNIGVSMHRSGSPCDLSLAASSFFVIFVAKRVTLSMLRSLWVCYPYVNVICQSLESDSLIMEDPCCDSALISPTYPENLPANYVLAETESFRKFTLADPQMTCNKCGFAEQPERLIFASRQKDIYVQFEKTDAKLALPTQGLEIEVLNLVFGKGSYAFRNEKFTVACRRAFTADGCLGSYDPTFFRETHMTVGAVKLPPLGSEQMEFTDTWLLDSTAALFKVMTREFSAAEVTESVDITVVGIFLLMAVCLTLLLSVEATQAPRPPIYDPHNCIGKILNILNAFADVVWTLVQVVGLVFIVSLIIRSKNLGICVFLWRILCFVLSLCISAEVVSMLSNTARVIPPNSYDGLAEFFESNPSRLAVSERHLESALTKHRSSSKPIHILVRGRGDAVADPERVARLVASGSHVALHDRRVLENGMHHASDVSSQLVISDMKENDQKLSWAMQRDCSLLRSTNMKLVQFKEMGIISWIYMKQSIGLRPATPERGKSDVQGLSSTLYCLQSLGAIMGVICLLFELSVDRLAKFSGCGRANIPSRPT